MKTLVLWRIMEGKSTSWCIFQTFHNDSMTFRSGDWEAVWCCLVFINCSWNFHPEIWNWKEKTASVPHCAPDPHIFYLYITIPIFFWKETHWIHNMKGLKQFIRPFSFFSLDKAWYLIVFIPLFSLHPVMHLIMNTKVLDGSSNVYNIQQQACLGLCSPQFLWPNIL